jgi:hypothetical protein
LSSPPLTQGESEGESASSDAYEGQRASTQTEENGAMQQPETSVANVAESTLPPPSLISSPIPISKNANGSISLPDQMASISPSRAITSALASAVNVRSFKDTFFGPSTPPNLDSVGADKHASISNGQPVSGGAPTPLVSSLFPGDLHLVSACRAVKLGNVFFTCCNLKSSISCFEGLILCPLPLNLFS